MFMSILSSLKQQKLSAILNSIGLVAALSVTYLILSQYYFYTLWNRGIDDYERIFRVDIRMGADSWTAFTDKDFQDKLLTHSPLLEGYFIYDRHKSFTIIEFKKSNNAEQSGSLFAMRADSCNLITLGVKLTVGSFDKIVGGNGIALAEGYAHRNGIQLGDEVVVGNKHTCTVEAFFEDFPHNSDFRQIRLIMSIDNNTLSKNGETNGILYVKLRSADDCKDFIRTAASIIASMGGDEYAADIDEHIRLTRIDYCKYTKDLSAYAGYVESGNNILFWLVAIVILAVAFINYFNFFVASVPRRMRNINIRKVMGAQRLSIYLELLLESVLLVSVALALSQLLINMFPKEILGNEISVSDSFHSFAMLASISIIAAVATAAYPAWYVSSFSPAFILKGSFVTGTSGKAVRNTLLAVQYVASFLFIIISFTMYYQFISLKNSDFGFDEDFYAYQYSTYSHDCDKYAAELKKCKAVKDVTFTFMKPLTNDFAVEFHSMSLDKKINLNCRSVGCNYTQFMGIDIIEGRAFTDNEDGDKYIITESVKRESGIEVGDFLSHNGTHYAEVVGVCSDFADAYEGIVPSILCYKKNHEVLHYVLFRLADGYTVSDVVSHIDEIGQYYSASKQKRSEIESFDNIFRQVHESLIVSAHIFAMFAMVALTIALLGVFGIVFFETQYRRKEIAIRRVNGATRDDILRMFMVRYFKIISICYLFALPIAVVLIRFDVALAKSLSPWIFIFAFFAVSLLTFSVVVASAWKVVNENPSDIISKG